MKLKNEIIKGVGTLNYQVEIYENVFFSVVFVDKNNVPIENYKIESGQLIEILDCIAILFKNNINISIGITIDYGIDLSKINDIYMVFEDGKLNIQYSLF